MAARVLFVVDDVRHLGDHVSAALDFHPVADLHPESFDLVQVVQGGAANGGTSDGDRFQSRNRREFPGASDLNQNVLNLGDARASSVFVGNGPAGRFAGKAQFLLQSDAVDLHHNAVDLVGKVFALSFPLFDEGPHCLEILGQARWIFTLNPAVSRAFNVSQ